MNAVDEILDKLWVAGVTLENAETISAELTGDQANDIEAFLQEIGLLSLTPNDDASKDVSRGQALFLAAMAKHHSDSIVSLPGPLRKKRMERLAIDIRVPTAVVQLAVQLGPAGIERHVAAAQE